MCVNSVRDLFFHLLLETRGDARLEFDRTEILHL